MGKSKNRKRISPRERIERMENRLGLRMDQAADQLRRKSNGTDQAATTQFINRITKLANVIFVESGAKEVPTASDIEYTFLGWNFAVTHAQLPELDVYDQFCTSMQKQGYNAEDIESMLGVHYAIREVKREWYPDDTRFAAEFEVKDAGDSFDIRVKIAKDAVSYYAAAR